MSIIKDPSRFKEYLQFLTERQKIWYKKEIEKQPYPWTDDEILQKAKFTNIYRELDRTTLWELKKLKEIEDPVDQLELILLLRWCNSPITVESLLTSESREEFEAKIPYIRKQGKLMSDAIWYAPPRGWTRETWCWGYYSLVRQHKKKIFHEIQECREVEKIIPELVLPHLPRIGEFLGYEMFTSMTYCDWFSWTEDDWFVVGPGCRPGLEYFIDRKIQQKNIHEVFLKKFKELRSVIPQCFLVTENNKLTVNMFWWGKFIDKIPEITEDDPVFNKYSIEKFTLRTFEHSLCEFRKYINIRDKGRIRRKYILR